MHRTDRTQRPAAAFPFSDPLAFCLRLVLRVLVYFQVTRTVHTSQIRGTPFIQAIRTCRSSFPLRCIVCFSRRVPSSKPPSAVWLRCASLIFLTARPAVLSHQSLPLGPPALCHPDLSDAVLLPSMILVLPGTFPLYPLGSSPSVAANSGSRLPAACRGTLTRDMH